MEQNVCEDLASYFKAVQAIQNSLKVNGAERWEKAWYRGHDSVNYDLIPSIARHGHSKSIDGLLRMERHIIAQAKAMLPNIFKEEYDAVSLLALMQHYGLPTRLLDITRNPLVALYFACQENARYKDGEVIVFVNNELDERLYPIDQAFAETYLLTSGSGSLADFYNIMVRQPYFRIQGALKDELGPDIAWLKSCATPSIVYPSFLTERQKAQSCGYILFPNKILKTVYDELFDNSIGSFGEYDENEHLAIRQQIKIPSGAKTSILDELRHIGITKSKLFPESVDYACEELMLNIYNYTDSDYDKI